MSEAKRVVPTVCWGAVEQPIARQVGNDGADLTVDARARARAERLKATDHRYCQCDDCRPAF